VFVGPHGLGDYQQQEARSAIAKSRADGNRTRVFLVLLPGGSLDDIPVTEPLRQRTLVRLPVLAAGDERFDHAMAQFEWAVTGVPPAAAPSPPARVAAAAPVAAQALDSDLMDEFRTAVRARGLVMVLGRSWAGEAEALGAAAPVADLLDEPYVLGQHMLDQLLEAGRERPSLLPPLDDIASCFRTRRGADRLDESLRQALIDSPGVSAPLPVGARLGGFLRAQLASASARSRGAPVIMATGLGLVLEGLLLQQGIPFVRCVAARDNRKGAQIVVHDCSDPAFLALAGQRLGAAGDGRHAAALDLMLQAPGQAVSSPLEDVVSRLARPSVVLLKCMGSIDVENSVIITRAHTVDYALAYARGGAGATFVRSVLASRPVLIAGFRPLDLDFSMLDNLVIRPALIDGDDRNPCLMVVAAAAARGAASRNPMFLADEVEQQGAAALRRSLVNSRIQAVDGSLGRLLDGLAEGPG
jgi:hypothetical protein